MRFFVLFLIFATVGFAVFGILGMMYGMEYGHGFCFAVSAGPLCPEVISAFISHLTNFQKMFVFVLREMSAFLLLAIWFIVWFLLLRGAPDLHFAFSSYTRQDFLSRFAVAKQKFLLWLAFHEQSPAVLFGA